MFKFKMSLLLKNVKFRVAVAVLAIAAIVAGIVFIPTNKADNISQQVNIKANQSGVTVGGHGITVIEKDGKANGYNNLFCIEEDQDLSYKTYSNPIDISKAGSYFSNYNAAMWLINNMYVSNVADGNGVGAENARRALAMNIANLATSETIKNKVASDFNYDGSNVTSQKIFNLRNKTIGGTYKKNALEVVEQIALWKYTKNVGTIISSAYRNNPNTYFVGAGLTDDEQKTLKYFYYALTTLADMNSGSAQTQSVSNPVSLDKSQAKFDESTMKVGPYYIVENGIKWTSYNFGPNSGEGNFPAVVEITTDKGDIMEPATPTDLFEKNSDGSFYVNLSAYPNATQLYFRIQYILTGINTNAYVVDGGDKQNLLNIDKSVSVASVKDTVEIKVTAPEGKYNVLLKKVKKDGTTVITSSEATFKVNGTETNTAKGILNIADKKDIANAEQVDSYEITETKAPEGFKPFDGTLKLNVKFKEVDKKFIIDEENTTSEGFKDGAKVDVSADTSTITIVVPNEELPKPGEYNVELYKVDNKGNIVTTPATFDINGKEATTSNGKITVASNVKVEDETTVGKYVIKETKAPEHFNMFDGTITLTAKMTKVDNTYVLKQNGITFNYDNSNATVKPTFTLDGSTIKVYVPNEKQIFDLALRKFISKIDGVKVEPSREPVVDAMSIINLMKTGTASYYHNKNSLGVTLGSEVEYTIRVYNEGEILGYAKQITDYLPEGLSFLRIADESKSLYTTTSAVGSKVVVLNYNGNTLIKSLRDFIPEVTVTKNNITINVTNEYYQEVKIICKVEKTDATYITSRSEITNYGYTETNADGNKVWKEAKAIGNVDIDSVQDTIKGALGLDTWYENAQERTYVDGGNVIVDKNYYPGVQDDDDFETVELLTGKYNIIIKKVDSKNQEKTLPGAYFSVKGTNVNTEVGPTGANGEVAVVKGVQIQNDKQADSYTIKETKAPAKYKLYNGEIKVNVGTKYDGRTFVIDTAKTTVNGKDIKFNVNKENTTLTVIVPDEEKEFDLSLRKFITDVNGKAPEVSREPQVDISKLASKESTTATYNHPKNPLDVNPTDIVTYTIRVFNEGELDGYANKVMDDIPEGLEFLPENETNKTYKWVMYKEMKDGDKGEAFEYNNKKYVVTKNAKEADLIITDYLSIENGKDNLIKAFDATSKKLDYKDVKVAFKVVEPETSDRILINYAQITDDSDSDGKSVTDRDSTTNIWIEGEDDQDIEKVKVRYFDLALRKWVTKAIVYENGNKTVTETNHSPWDEPEQVVKVDLKNTNIDNVEVKFEYSIRVINQGEIAGYAKEVADYLPAGLKFVPGDNPQWVEAEDGVIVTKALENTLLQPGEYADVTVVLTWINGADNLGLKNNIAEIRKDFNEVGAKDIDSTPGNKVPGEDDIDDAPVILAIRTGAPVVYTGVAVAVIAIVSLGVVAIRKRVLTA